MKKLGKILGLIAIAAIGAVSLVACSGGQKVTEEVWKAALDAKFTQGTITMTAVSKQGVEFTSSTITKVTADKIQLSGNTKLGDKEETRESYMAKEGDKYYAYSKEDGKWVKTEISKEMFEEEGGSFTISTIVSGVLAGLAGEVKYSDFTFEKGVYSYTKDDMTVSIVFKSKKIASIKAVKGTGDAQSVGEVKIDYGKPSITLPKVG